MGQYYEERQIYTYTLQLKNPETRNYAINRLSEIRNHTNFAQIMWSNYDAIAICFDEILISTDAINSPELDIGQCNRICSVLSILDSLASHQEIKQKMISLKVVQQLYLFIASESKSGLIEYVRLTSLAVLANMMKDVNDDFIIKLLQTEIIPILIRVMMSGSEMGITMATLTLRIILMSTVGFTFVCRTLARFKGICEALENVVMLLIKNPSTQLLKDVIACYLRLTVDLRARAALANVLPKPLKNGSFDEWIKVHPNIKQLLIQLLVTVYPEGTNEAKETKLVW